MQSGTEKSDVSGGRLNAGLGCVAAGFIIISCVIGAVSTSIFAVSFTSPGFSNMTGEALSSVVRTLAFWVGFLLSGLAPFVGTLLLLHGVFVLPHVPNVPRKDWYRASAAGAVVYWFVFWALWTTLIGVFRSFEDVMRQVEDDVIATSGVIAVTASAGALMVFASTLPLAYLQWLVLRRYSIGATRWAIAFLAVNALMTGTFIGFFLWGTRWGWN